MPLPSLSLRPSTQMALATSIRLRLKKILEDSTHYRYKITTSSNNSLHVFKHCSEQPLWLDLLQSSQQPYEADTCYPHFIEEGTEAQQSEMTCHRSHSKQLNLDLRRQVWPQSLCS